MKKVAFLAYCDYANVLTEYSNVINTYSEKYQSKVICLKKHPFNYTLQHDYDLNTTNKVQEALKWIADSEHIIFGEEMGLGQYNTLTTFINKYKIDINGKKISVWHPGSNYRKGAANFNKNPFNSKLHRRIYALDLYPASPKTAKDIVLLPFKNFDVDFDKYMDNARAKIKQGVKTILHCPSNPSKKGTALIKKVVADSKLDPKKFKFEYLTGVGNDVVMKAKNNATFYIDQFNNVGSFGVATIESIIAGNIVICKIDKVKEGLVQLNSKSRLPIQHAGTNEQTFKKVLNQIINQDEKTLETMFQDNVDYLREHYYGPNVITYLEKNLLDG